jgi:anti-sigma factor RsiW
VTPAELLTCHELVELVTDYLEDALPPAERARFDSHVKGCDPCLAYLRLMRTTLDLLGRLAPEDIEPDVERTLLRAFRTWKTQSQAT